MNYFSLRVISSLMVATPRKWSQTLAEREDEIPYGPYSHEVPTRLLREYKRNPAKAIGDIQKWRDEEGNKPNVVSFRKGAVENFEWAVQEVMQRINLIKKDLKGDQRADGRLLVIDNSALTGGFHLHVIWEDGSERLVYFLGPKSWSNKRIRAMIGLLQMKAVQVYGMLPSSVVVVAFGKRKLYESEDFDRDVPGIARSTVRNLKAWLRKRSA